MNWFAYALLGAAAFAATAVLDKLILDKYVQNSNAYLLSLIVLQQIFAVGIYAFLGLGFVYPQSLFAVAAGLFQCLLWISYLKALQVEEVSRVTALIFIYPIFVFPAALILLKEALTLGNYFGGLLLVASALLLSRRPSSKRGSLIISPSIKYLFFFWICSAAYSVSAKYLLFYMSEWHLIMWSSIGNLLTVLPLLLKDDLRAEALRYFQSGHLLLLAFLADEAFDFLGRSALIFGYAMGSVSLVSSVSALQPFITLIYVISLSIFIPGLLEEELDRKTLALKLGAVAMIVLGVYFVS